MRARMRMLALFLLLTAVFHASGAGARLCSRSEDECLNCGVSLLRPLAGRTVAPFHRIDVMTSCSDAGFVRMPRLWTREGPLESEWLQTESSPVDFTAQSFTRWRRIGPPLPQGTQVMLGMQGPLACELGSYGETCNGYRIDCAENPEVDCCSIPGDAPLTALLAFDVSGEPLRSLDAGTVPSIAAAADGGVAEAETAVIVPPLLALRCARSGDSVNFYLDLGVPPLDDAIVDVDLEWYLTSSAVADSEPHGVTRAWRSQPCVGQLVRRFEMVESRSLSFALPPEPGSYAYAISVGGEAGPLAAPIEGSLRLPDDCVSPSEIELSWQAQYFSVQCNEAESPPLADLTYRYPELLETKSTGDCFLEGPDETVVPEPEPLLVPRVDVAPSEATTLVEQMPDPTPAPTSWVEPAATKGEPRSSGCSLGRSPSGTAPLALLVLLSTTRRRRSVAPRRTC